MLGYFWLNTDFIQATPHTLTIKTL